MRKIVLLIVLLSLNGLICAQIEEPDSLYYDSLDNYSNQEYEYYGEEFEQEAVAEEEYNPSGYLGEINLLYGKPVGLMKRDFEKNALGIDIDLYKQWRKTSPLYVGGGFFILGYDSESVSYFDYNQEDGLEYEFSEDFKGRIFGVNLGAKYFSTKSIWVFAPYVQLDFEYRRAYASIEDVNIDLDETVNTEFEGGNSGFGYNISFGSIVALKSDRYFLNLKLTYSSGGGLFLYKRNGTTSANFVIDYFDKKYIPFGIMSFKIGVVFL